jgi:hypothetical protein
MLKPPSVGTVLWGASNCKLNRSKGRRVLLLSADQLLQTDGMLLASLSPSSAADCRQPAAAVSAVAATSLHPPPCSSNSSHCSPPPPPRSRTPPLFSLSLSRLLRRDYCDATNACFDAATRRTPASMFTVAFNSNTSCKIWCVNYLRGAGIVALRSYSSSGSAESVSILTAWSMRSVNGFAMKSWYRSEQR